MLSTANLWPDDVEEQTMALECWQKACNEKDVNLDFTEEACLLITRCGSQLRGELKTKARPIVKTLFRLKAPVDDKDANKLRKFVHGCLKSTLYIYKNLMEEAGAYEHSIIQNVVNAMWFTNTRDKSILCFDYFAPRIPNMTIALIATVNIFEEWTSGEFTPIDFSKENYQKATMAYRALPAIQEELLSRARNHARAPGPQSDHAKPVFDEARLAKLARERAARRSNPHTTPTNNTPQQLA
ncbi:hypothetical protein PsYK624_164190 [Phanerochaete sordida]|uniref:DUF6532 domain-containing protein n=1 Tax=Phanerochaete sordida TaxID=48140 RepID=A0A9P3GT79_9APHY|nr:hypothetical protein PsYK624_164190 [Phanerochaete sordida]